MNLFVRNCRNAQENHQQKVLLKIHGPQELKAESIGANWLGTGMLVHLTPWLSTKSIKYSKKDIVRDGMINIEEKPCFSSTSIQSEKITYTCLHHRGYAHQR